MSCTASGFLPAADARLKGRNDRVIYAEICAIEQMILDALNNCTTTAPMDIVINGGTPITSPDGISEINIVDAGSEYIESSPTVTITSTNGTGFVGTAIVDPSTGEVLGFNITDRGQGYQAGDVVTVTHAAGATGVTFVGEVSVVSEPASFGVGYSSAFSQPNGNSQTSSAVAGEVLGISITNGGTNYLDTPYVTVIDPEGSGSGFVGTIALDPTDNSIASITIVNAGRNYSPNSTAVIVGDVAVTGTQAIITTTTQSSMFQGLSVDPVYYYQVWAGLVDDKAVMLQIDTIQKYFTDLGYNFIINVNPTTMDTLQWYISW